MLKSVRSRCLRTLFACFEAQTIHALLDVIQSIGLLRIACGGLHNNGGRQANCSCMTGETRVKFARRAGFVLNWRQSVAPRNRHAAAGLIWLRRRKILSVLHILVNVNSRSVRRSRVRRYWARERSIYAICS